MAKQTRLRLQQGRSNRLALLVVTLLICGGVAGWKLVDSYQLNQKFQSLFFSDQEASIRNSGVRGTIYDRNYKDMAVSLERVSVYARTRELESVEETVELLSSVLGVDTGHLREKIAGDSLRAWLVKNISREQEETMRRLEFPGIFLHKELSRYYPEETTAAHLIGFVEDDIGLAGVEYFYDRLARRQLEGEQEREYRGRTTQDVLLTVDLKIQKILESVVRDLSHGREGVRIGAYVMDSGSGALVSAVQFPSFNPNTYRLYSREILASMLFQPMLLPGKFRLLLRDTATLQNQYESRGKIYPWSVSTDVRSLGGELRLWDRLGFSRSLPPDFAMDETHPLETSRYYFQPERDMLDYGTVPETLTPLQLLTGLSSLVNGGAAIQPFVVDKVVDPVSKSEYHLSKVDGQVIPGEAVAPSVSREVASLLSHQAVAGELGAMTLVDTIQTIVVGKEGHEVVRNQVLFTAIPVNEAELTVLVTLQGISPMVQEKAGGGDVDAVHAVHQVLPRIAVLQQVGKSISDVVEPDERDIGYYPVDLEKIKKEIAAQATWGIAEPEVVGSMPDLVGLSLRKSLRLLQGNKCEIKIHGTGKVVRQQPKAATSLTDVSACILTLQQKEDVSLEKLEEKMTGKE